MRILRATSRRLLFWSGLALLIWPLYELYVRFDAMYKPLKMFVDMAVGEGIPPARAASYIDWSLLQTPAYLLGCVLLGILALAMRRKTRGGVLIALLSAGLGLYGWFDTPLYTVQTFRLLELAPFLVALFGGCFSVAAGIARGRGKRDRSDQPHRSTRIPRRHVTGSGAGGANA